ncbi:membrane cofactor protein-like [Argopecten irradians]|uniref:membrane cofactor protein-like n=1 Tax=Argopecten irradians TaxID=31199 RepID=UPI003713804D
MVGGPATLTCQGNGQWSSPAFQCDYIDCGTPNPISNAAVSGGGTVLGEKRVYSCNSGYTSSGFPEIMCQQSGAWSATSFICYAVDD